MPARPRLGPLLGFALAILLAGCSAAPEPSSPALWRVEGPAGQRGYLFGTIHALDRPAAWNAGPVAAALSDSDRIVVEVAGLTDAAALQQTFSELAQSRGLPPLSARISPALRPKLEALLAQAGLTEDKFATTETWAAALTLARAGQSAKTAQNGIDRAVLAAAARRPVIELEGAAAQLGLFNALPEREQRDLLEAVLRDGTLDAESADLAQAWRKGDMALIERETRCGILADPELREALYSARNRNWTARLAAMLGRGEHPFVAVGAAHMAGPEGLPALLKASGYTVTRVQ